MTASSRPLSSAYLLTIRQIIRSSEWSISATSARNFSSNSDWLRRSYQSRCIVASSRSVPAMAAPKPVRSSSAVVAVATIAS